MRTHWQRPVRPRPPQRATCYGVRGSLARKRSTPQFLTGATVMALYPDTRCFYLQK
ncbi:hypothetical protein BGW80DRAFT_1307313 [Lactifluus volemus]|nr:hypothetical protein BGW80DRAFT_1307313 [Lactifluus volemus]